MKLQPEERPCASRVKKHAFLKTDSNPFLKDLNDYLKKKTDCINPFIRMMTSSDSKNCGDMQKSKVAFGSVKQQKNVNSNDNSIDAKLHIVNFKWLKKIMSVNLYTVMMQRTMTTLKSQR